MSNLESGNAVLQTIHASDGGRALKLLQERQKRQAELDGAKQQIASSSRKRRLTHIDEKYKESTTEALEDAFKQETVGLVTAEQFRERRKLLAQKIEKIEEDAKASAAAAAAATARAATRHPRSRAAKSKLSFGEDLSESGEEETASDVKEERSDSNEKLSTQVKTKYFGKDPTVNTSFLLDVDREEKLRLEMDRIAEEYRQEQEAVKEQMLEVTYSYWDGTGHRRAARVKKGDTVGHFVGECCRTLEREFSELRTVSTDNLMYVKEDLILPHTISFYELIKNKARGKSGPLFNFDVHDDVRMQSDARIEKDEAHAGKIVERKWYERNKHIFPASRWEPFNPTKTYDKYTIKGDASSSVQK